MPILDNRARIDTVISSRVEMPVCLQKIGRFSRSDQTVEIIVSACGLYARLQIIATDTVADPHAKDAAYRAADDTPGAEKITIIEQRTEPTAQ